MRELYDRWERDERAPMVPVWPSIIALLGHNIRRGAVRRVKLVPQFGEYYLAFMIWKDRVVIPAVAHAKRRPYYWCGRVGDARKLF